MLFLVVGNDVAGCRQFRYPSARDCHIDSGLPAGSFCESPGLYMVELSHCLAFCTLRPDLFRLYIACSGSVPCLNGLGNASHPQ